ncbi:MAG: leucyl aminopeptidase [Acidimicrobiales bacterium]
MTISFTLATKPPANVDLRAVGVTTGQLDEEPHGLDWATLRARGFEAKVAQIQIVGADDGGPPVAAVGLGPAADITPVVIRRASAALARASRRSAKLSSALLDDIGDAVERVPAAQAHAEGLVLGAYEYRVHKSEGTPHSLTKVTVTGGGGAPVRNSLKRGAAIADAVCFARDLVNEPGGTLTPPELATRAQEMADKVGLKAKILDEAAIRKAKLGGLLGVNRGSEQPPRLIELTYTPAKKAKGSLALVGKGITFDAGGLSIKTGQGMMTMKMDMGGGAAVLGAMSALPGLAPAVKVTAYVPVTDNMLGGDATRPGDVLTIRNGKTVEVLNTDAEGRLVLADALSLASEAEPDAIVDLATLTGACLIALGGDIAGLMGNDDAWVDQVRAAADSAGEEVWPLPLPDGYRSQLDSPVADLKNIGGSHGGALTAGLFLKEFVADGIPWAHIDIAGPAFNEAVRNEAPKGGSGFGVRLLLQLVEDFSPPGS